MLYVIFDAIYYVTFDVYLALGYIGAISVKLLIDKDWSSTCFWVPGAEGGWVNASPDQMNLTPELFQRCEYLSEWFEIYNPGSSDPEPDWDAYSAYTLALAIDIKKHYGQSAQIFIRNGNEVVEVTGIKSSMLNNAT